jgi:hypothetical protein
VPQVHTKRVAAVPSKGPTARQSSGVVPGTVSATSVRSTASSGTLGAGDGRVQDSNSRAQQANEQQRHGMNVALH